MTSHEHHLHNLRLLDGKDCKCGSMIICESNGGRYGRVCCAFKSTCYDRSVPGKPTPKEVKTLKENAQSRKDKLKCRLNQCPNTGNQRCGYVACQSCCREQKKLCLLHRDRDEYERLTPDWRAEKYSDGLPVEIWCVKNSPIAEGGFAQIDHGRWGHHEVAIKTMIVQENEVITTRRNQNELGVWKEVDHPNLVPLWATIDKGGLKSMVTPFYKHGDLMKYLKHIEEQGRCSAVPNNNLALRYHLLVGAAEGLRYLHDKKNTAHGDLSMRNILVSEDLVSDDKCALLTDFGLAVPPSRTGYTTSGNQNGCRMYKAPECFPSRDSDSVPSQARTPASDMWAFGIIIVQVLCNRWPYGGPKDPYIISGMVGRGSKPFSDVELNECPMRTGLRDVVRACFNQAPEVRPSIGSVLEELKESESHCLEVDR